MLKEAEKLPPTFLVLEYEIICAHYVTSFERHAKCASSCCLPMGNSCCTFFIMKNDFLASRTIIEMRICSCQKNCNAYWCSCRKNMLNCTIQLLIKYIRVFHPTVQSFVILRLFKKMSIFWPNMLFENLKIVQKHQMFVATRALGIVAGFRSTNLFQKIKRNAK